MTPDLAAIIAVVALLAVLAAWTVNAFLPDTSPLKNGGATYRAERRRAWLEADQWGRVATPPTPATRINTDATGGRTVKDIIANLSPATRRAIGIVIAAFVGGVLTAFMAAGGDVFALDLRSLVNAGVGAAATVVAAWLLPLYKGIGIGSDSSK